MTDSYNKSVFVFDLDGTIYIEDEPIEGAPDIISAIRNSDRSVYFLSNNSSRSSRFYCDRLRSMGIDVDTSDLVLSTDSVIEFLKTEKVNEVFVVGTKDMRQELADKNINPTATDPEHVIVGFDRELTYEKLRKASLFLQNDIGFIAAHPDRTCPTPEGPIPDCWSIITLLETATNRSPDRILGKPDPMMLEAIYERGNCRPEDVVLVGDRLNTDIRMANSERVTSVCVLSGDASNEEIENSSHKPDYIVDSVCDLSSLPFFSHN